MRIGGSQAKDNVTGNYPANRCRAGTVVVGVGSFGVEVAGQVMSLMLLGSREINSSATGHVIHCVMVALVKTVAT